MSFLAFLNHSADLQSPTYDTDRSAGLTREPWDDVATGEMVRIEDASAREIMSYYSRGLEITHRVFTTSGSPKNGYRWSYGGRYYIVKEILRRRQLGTVDDYYVNMCREVAPDG